VVALLSFGALFGVVPCSASTLYASDYYAGPSNLYHVDQQTGGLDPLEPGDAVDLLDLASDTRRASFTVWGVSLAGLLYTLDPATGLAISSIPITGTRFIISNLAFDPVTHVLYGATSYHINDGRESLYTIDPRTGLATYIGTIGSNGLAALSFDGSGQLFGITGGGGRLYSIDSHTGAGAFVAEVPLSLPLDIAARPEDGAMFLADSDSQMIYTLDTATGAVTFVGPFGRVAEIEGLAFGPAEPMIESGTFALCGLGLAGLGLARRGGRTRNEPPRGGAGRNTA
jgi:outer membrane protein assembly factor BamB